MACKDCENFVKGCERNQCCNFKPRWIPVSERLPKDGERVLAITESGNQFVGFHTQFSGWHFEYVIHPTHCMPLPEPPMMD